MRKKVFHVFQKEIPIRHPIFDNSDIKLMKIFTNKLISEEYKLFQTWEIGYPDGNGLSAEPHIQNQRYTKQLLQYYFIQKKVLPSGLINFSFTSCYEQEVGQCLSKMKFSIVSRPFR